MDNDFEIVLSRVKQILNVDKDKDVAVALGMNPSAFNNRKRSGSIPYPQYVALAKQEKVDLNWLFEGIGPMYKDAKKEVPNQNQPSGNDRLVVIEHIDLVKEYEDQQRALRINKNLLIIERKNKQAFRDMDNYVAGIANGLKYSAPQAEDPDPEPHHDIEPPAQTRPKETVKKIY